MQPLDTPPLDNPLVTRKPPPPPFPVDLVSSDQFFPELVMVRAPMALVLEESESDTQVALEELLMLLDTQVLPPPPPIRLVMVLKASVFLP
jgi:hypothetical protein